MLTRDDLTALRGIEVRPAVSIFMPTHIAGSEIRQDPVRLKNLLRVAEEQLHSQGFRKPEADLVLQPAHALLEDTGFWQHQLHGLALFLAPGFHRSYNLPIETQEKVVVSAHFHLKPLLPLLAKAGGFWVLTLSADRAKLFRGSKLSFKEILEIGIPQSGDHGSQPERPFVDGVEDRAKNEGPGEVRQVTMVNFMKRAEAAIHERLNQQSAPLVLAATSQVQGHFRSQTKLPGLLEEGVDINPDMLAPAELHRLALQVVEPILDQGRRQAIDHFNSLVDDFAVHNRTSMKVEEVLKAAAFGRVNELLIAEGEALWGKYDPAKDHVEAHGHEVPGDEDLLDLAAVHTLINGGSVHVLPRETMPHNSVIAATFRYEAQPASA